VSLGHLAYPAADLSEISTAGKEASGTGNMKFALNGALTIGAPRWSQHRDPRSRRTENFFLFGLNAEEVSALKAKDTTRATTTHERGTAAGY